MNKELENKVALVTGGARDIGRSVSLKLAALGASVVVNYNSNSANADATVKAVADAGGKAVAVQADVSKPADIERLVQTALKTFGGKIDILVNVAGGLVARRPLAEIDEAFFDQVMGVNFKSTVLVTRAVVPHMPDGGVIVNFSSQAARDGGGPGASIYAASKAAVANFTRSLVKELGPRRIRANAVAPGMISTAFHDTFTKPEVRARVAGMTPLGREGSPDEVAELTAFLASPRSSFINGESVEINGGIFFA
ncbi:glucose 1-dehydrogenase [Termitidicoccus mucosus]|uniref:Oxidoreductase n=1 Tax=Termitidicoccus mucosus TaxID=1184151 RepID=A0A178IDY5_9BACT|nr:oxidoreductase [Opitutaceae bacterium TSB47]